MVEPKTKEIGPSFPLFIAAISGAAILASLVPLFADWLIYDRVEIGQGQIWRLFTGNLVHFSPNHLFFNLLVFVIVGWTIANRGYPGFTVFCLLCSGLIGTVLYGLSPNLAQYGGLSGVACGTVVYLALFGLAERGVWRALCASVLLLTVCKILLEYRLGHFLFATSPDPAFVPMPLSHAVGALTAFIVFLLVRGVRSVAGASGNIRSVIRIQTMEPKEEKR